MQLGIGFDISNPLELKQRAFEWAEVLYDEESAETSISYSVISSNEEFQEELGVDGFINDRFLFASLKGAFEFNKNSAKWENYTTLMFKNKTHFGNKGFVSYGLNTDAKTLIDSEEYDQLIEKYGTHFVQKTSTGVSINVFISIKNF